MHPPDGLPQSAQGQKKTRFTPTFFAAAACAVAAVCVLALATRPGGQQTSLEQSSVGHRSEVSSAERAYKKLQEQYTEKEEDRLQKSEEKAEQLVASLEDEDQTANKQKQDTAVSAGKLASLSPEAAKPTDTKVASKQALFKTRTAQTDAPASREGEGEAADGAAADAMLQDESPDESTNAEAPAEAPTAASEPSKEAAKQDEGRSTGIPDPAETTRKAQEMADHAGQAASDAWEKVEEAFTAEVPVEGMLESFGWHLDLCCYLATTYAVYYIWKTELWHKILPKLKFEEDAEELPETTKANVTDIGNWTEEHGEGKGAPNAQDLLWFRRAQGEDVLFLDSRRVSPGVVETLLCGCGGNVAALAVTTHRLIIQHDKRCMFGTTVLTTNEETVFHSQIHKTSLHTDGLLNLGVCTLHSDAMLSGGFLWIAAGLLIDLVLHWRSAILHLITDQRLKGWVALIQPDLVHLLASLCVLFGAFLLLALLFFLICPQSILKLEIVKQAGVRSYTKTFQLPVTEAYAMYDAVMRGRIERRSGYV